MGYSIWLEFEQYETSDSSGDDDGYCNMEITYDDGRHQIFNVWTIDYFRENVPRILNEAEQNGFATLPDIIVSRLEREHITEIVKQIVPP